MRHGGLCQALLAVELHTDAGVHFSGVVGPLATFSAVC